MITPEQEQRFQTLCLFTLTTIMVGMTLFWLKPVMIPFILAVFFTLILIPLIDIQTKWFKFPRLLSVITTLILGLILLMLFVILVSASINQMTANAELYQTQIAHLITKGADKLNLERFNLEPHQVLDPIISKMKEGIGGTIFGTINAILKILSQGVLVLIFAIFLLLGKTATGKPPAVWVESENRIKRYIVTKVTLSAITGVLVGAVLMFFGIDLALVFGLLAFLLNFIPSVGSIIATLLPLPIVLITPEITPLKATLALGIPGLIQFSIGNVIEPKIMGDSLDLHPVVILMALIFWGMVWGIVGMLLAAPLTAIMKIVFEKIEFTTPLANLLAGRFSSDQE